MSASQRKYPHLGRKQALHRSWMLRDSITEPPTVAKNYRRSASTHRGRRLLLSMDYGTKTLAMAYRIVDERDDNSTTESHKSQIISFSRNACHAPQIAAWDNSGEFLWGYQVVTAMSREQLDEGNVLTLWKLLLYKCHATQPLSKRIEDQLGRKYKLVDFISLHLRSVIATAKQRIKDTMLSQEKVSGLSLLSIGVSSSKVADRWSVGN